MFDPVQAHRASQQYVNRTSDAAGSVQKKYSDCHGIPQIKRSNALINFLLLNAIAANLRVVHPGPPPRPHAASPTHQSRKSLQYRINSAHGRPVGQRMSSTGKESLLRFSRDVRSIPVSGGSFFSMAEASSSVTFSKPADWDAEHQIMTLEDDASKAGFIGELRNFLINQGISSESNANRLEFEWRQRAAGVELSIAPTPQQQFFPRDKRISQATREKNIAAHIKENCAFETEIVNTRGISEGTILLLHAQHAENPFHMLLEKEDAHVPNEWIRYASNGLNFVMDVVTFGIKPIIGNLLAAYLRRQHYLQKGDQICATRNIHIMFAQVATALTIEGLPLRSPLRQQHCQPVELADNVLSTSQAAYFARNRNVGVQTEVFITARNARAVEGIAETIFLKPQGESRFIAVEMDSANPDSSARSVVYDDQAKTWHFVDSDNNSPLEVQLSLGETFATIGGEQYKLRRTPEMQYEIMVIRKNGEQEYLPVYKEPISNRWHLKTTNHHASFTPRQRTLINLLRVPIDTDKTYVAMDNGNPTLYGEGKIYQIVTQGNAEELYNVVEMNGELIPVRQKQLAGHDVQYEAFNLAFPADKHYPIEWDGERWTLGMSTSPHICSALKRYVTPDMYASILDVKGLSPPNQRGIRRSPDGRTFIKVNRHYVEIHHGKSMRKGAPLFEEILIEYKDHQFHLAPGSVLPDLRKRVGHSSAASQFYANFKEDSKSVTPHYLSYHQIQNATTTMFPGEAISITQIASADLNKRRYVFARADDEYWFLETLPGGTRIALLLQMEQQRALEKFKARASGGSVQHVLTVHLKKQIPLGLEPTSRIIADITKKRIKDGWQLIKKVLEKQKTNNPQGKTLVLGHDDFFGCSSFARNSYALMEDAYETLIELFIPLSRLYPDAIIAPGSIYISQDIPIPYRINQNTYRQDGSEGELKNAVHFSANIAPVFYGGKIVAIARQGEYMTYQASPQQAEQSLHAATELRDLDHYIPPQAVFTVPNYWEPLNDEPSDSEHMRLGTVFSGKTLLPDERAIADRLLMRYMATSNTAARRDIQALFSNEFMIGEEKFLIVIGDESKIQAGFRPSVRNLALPADESAAEGNSYDWILQVAQKHQIDETMCSVADNCLIVDHAGQTEFFSETTPRTPIREHFLAEETIVYDYQID